MEDHAELIKQQMQDKRAELSDKLGQLEQKMTGNLTSASESVAETVQNVQDTVESVKQAFDVPSHVREHPWLAVGGGVLVGYLAHEFLTAAPVAASAAAGSGPLFQLGQYATRTALQLIGTAVRQTMPKDVGDTIGQMFDQMTESMNPEPSRDDKHSANGKH